MFRQDKTHYIDYRILQDTTKQSKKKLTNVDQCNMIMDLWSSSMKKNKIRREKSKKRKSPACFKMGNGL